MEGFGNPYTA